MLKQMYPFSKYNGTSMIQIPKIHKKKSECCKILVCTIGDTDFKMTHQVTA